MSRHNKDNITDEDFLEALRDLEELRESGRPIPIIEHGNFSFVIIDDYEAEPLVDFTPEIVTLSIFFAITWGSKIPIIVTNYFNIEFLDFMN